MGFAARTAGGAASDLIKDESVTGKQAYQLPTRYRTIARDYHVGPMAMVRHMVEGCSLFDRNKAYLHALTEAEPVRDTYRALSPDLDTLKAVIDDDKLGGYVECHVTVKDNPRLTIGPLPVRRQIHARVTRLYRTMPVWPVGSFRGSWPIRLLRNAIRHYGDIVSVNKVYQLAVCHMQRWLLPAYDILSAAVSKDSDVGKVIYNAFWSRFTPSEWMQGRVYPKGS
jgi:hypothetical protein